MEKGRRVYREHPSVQRVERSKIAQIRSGILKRTRGRPVSRRQGRDDIEVLRIEDVAWDKRYRVCLLRRSEEIMPDVRKFCKNETSKQ